MPAEVPPRLRPLTPKPAPFPKAGSSGAYGATQVAQRTKQLPFSLVGTWTQWFQSSQFEFAFKTNQTMRILGGIFVVAFLFFVVLATTSECSMFMFILLFFFFFTTANGGRKDVRGGDLPPLSTWDRLGGRHAWGPGASHPPQPQPARAPRTQGQLKTPPDTAFAARGRRQRPSPTRAPPK